MKQRSCRHMRVLYKAEEWFVHCNVFITPL